MYGPWRLIGEKDASAVTRLVTACYGDSYPDKRFYDPGALRTLVRSSGYSAVVAEECDGSLFGHIGQIVTPGAGAGLAYCGIIHPDHRNGGHYRAGLLALATLGQARGLSGLFFEVNARHKATQRASCSAGGVEVAFLPSFLPAGIEYLPLTENEPDGRPNAFCFFLPARRPLPERRVWVPSRLHSFLDMLWSACGLVRQVESIPLPSCHCAAHCGAAVRTEPNWGLATVEILCCRSEYWPAIERALSHLDWAEHVALHLALSCAHAPDLIDQLTAGGYCIGGVVPERFSSGDALLLQQPRLSPSSGDVTTSELGQRVRETVLDSLGVRGNGV